MFEPCVRCRRHVGVSETACPFCGEPFVRCRPPVRRAVATLGRAAIFAGASACASSAPPPQSPLHGESSDTVAAPGTFEGSVTDTQTGLPMPGVPVYLDAADGTQRQTRSDESGRYAFTGVPPGEYVVSTQTAPRRGRRRPDADEETFAGTRLEAGQTRVENVLYYDGTNPVKMPYGAPPRRSRLV